MPVHYVNVDVVGACVRYCPDFLSEASKVRRQD